MKLILKPALLVLLFSAWLAPPACAADAGGQFRRHEVTAVFLFNFAHFVTWPEASFLTEDSPLRYCISRSNPVADALQNVIEGERVGRHPLELVRFARQAPMPECHAVFVSEADREHLPLILQHAEEMGVLTVSDYDPPVDERPMITLQFAGNRLKPVIDMTAVTAAGLSMSSKLLQVAIVR